MNPESQLPKNSIAQRRKQLFSKIKLQIQQNNSLQLNKMLIHSSPNHHKGKMMNNDQNFSCFNQSTFDKTPDFIDHFNEKYKVLNKIGQGGNGVVFKCVNKETNIQYAVKHIRIDDQRKSELKKHFIFMKNLKHPNIMKYNALYIDQKRRLAYLVTEYCPFKGLDQTAIKDQDELKDFVRQILDALQYIHQKNICHRDIKPENILYDAQNKKIKIIDFGNAKKTYSRGARRDMLTVNGTYLFLAPQVFEGGGYNEKADLWALGVTIYKLASGSYPFQSEYVAETVEMIKSGEYSFKEKEWLRWSHELKSFVKELLRKVQQRISITDAREHKFMKYQIFKENSQKVLEQSKFSDSFSGFSKNQSKINSSFKVKRRKTFIKQQNSERKIRSNSIQSSSIKAQFFEQRIKQQNASPRSDHDSDEFEQEESAKKIISGGIIIPKILNYVSSSQYQTIEDEQICYTPPVYSKNYNKGEFSFEICESKFDFGNNDDAFLGS